jgi:hypothetical protein
MKQLCLILTLLLCAAAQAESSVVVGTPLKQFGIDLEVPCPKSDNPDEEFVCMDAWIGWEIAVTSTLTGPPIKGRIRAARIQHTKYSTRYFRSFGLFVLVPIVDEENRKAFGADYIIVEASAARRMHCFRREPRTYGLDDYVENLNGGEGPNGSGYCFELDKSPRK